MCARLLFCLNITPRTWISGIEQGQKQWHLSDRKILADIWKQWQINPLFHPLPCILNNFFINLLNAFCFMNSSYSLLWTILKIWKINSISFSKKYLKIWNFSFSWLCHNPKILLMDLSWSIGSVHTVMAMARYITVSALCTTRWLEA